MKVIRYFGFAILCSLGLPHQSSSQTGISHTLHNSNHRVQQIIADIRDATDVYRDQRMAQAAGYRKFGPDMPNMGVHWIHPGLAINRSFNLSKPSTLTYLNIDGEPTLTGVAYTFPVKPGETPPELPIDQMQWHFHSGNLEAEAHGLHAQTMHQQQQDEIQLSMVHAWVWSHNPDGHFVADNWALSYLRLGLAPPSNPKPDASKALFLVVEGGVEYFERFVELAVNDPAFDSEEILQIMHMYAEKVDEMVNMLHKQKAVTETDQAGLEKLWKTMWDEIRIVLGNQTWLLISRHLKTMPALHE